MQREIERLEKREKVLAKREAAAEERERQALGNAGGQSSAAHIAAAAVAGAHAEELERVRLSALVEAEGRARAETEVQALKQQLRQARVARAEALADRDLMAAARKVDSLGLSTLGESVGTNGHRETPHADPDARGASKAKLEEAQAAQANAEAEAAAAKAEVMAAKAAWAEAQGDMEAALSAADAQRE